MRSIHSYSPITLNLPWINRIQALQHLHREFSCVQLRVDWDVIIFTFVVKLINGRHNSRCSCSEWFQHLNLTRPYPSFLQRFNHLWYLDQSLCHLYFALFPCYFLIYILLTKILLLVIPGRMVPSSSGVISSVFPSLRFQTKNKLLVPTSPIYPSRVHRTWSNPLSANCWDTPIVGA